MNADLRLTRPAAVAVILVNWNGWRDTIECIASVLEQSHPGLHIFLVDNDSRDESIGNIGKWCAQPATAAQWHEHDGVARITDRSTMPVTSRIVDRPVHALPPPPPGCRVALIRSGGNLGFAGGCNVGIRAAGLDEFDFFWLLNTDTVVHRDALAALVRRAQASARIGMVGSTIRYYDRPHIVEALAGARMEIATITTRQIGQGRRLDELTIDAAGVEAGFVLRRGCIYVGIQRVRARGRLHAGGLLPVWRGARLGHARPQQIHLGICPGQPCISQIRCQQLEGDAGIHG